MAEVTPPNDGEWGAAIRRKLGSSWKTSAAGAVVLFASVVSDVANAQPDLISPAIAALCASMATKMIALGLFVSKDWNVSGGKR